MAEIGIVPLLNAQQLSMIWLGHEAAVRPEAAQAATRDLALSLLRQEAEQIEKPGNSNRSTVVEDDGGSGGRPDDPPRREKHGEKKHGEEASPSSPNPLVGNLLNVTV
jgi:hypothetical protein